MEVKFAAETPDTAIVTIVNPLTFTLHYRPDRKRTPEDVFRFFSWLLEPRQRTPCSPVLVMLSRANSKEDGTTDTEPVLAQLRRRLQPALTGPSATMLPARVAASASNLPQDEAAEETWPRRRTTARKARRKPTTRNEQSRPLARPPP